LSATSGYLPYPDKILCLIKLLLIKTKVDGNWELLTAIIVASRLEANAKHVEQLAKTWQHFIVIQLSKR